MSKCDMNCLECKFSDCIMDDEPSAVDQDEIDQLTEMMDDFAKTVGKGYSLSPTYRKMVSRRHYLIHREEMRIKNAQYYQDNKERIDARNRAWALAHPEAMKAISRRSLDKQREFNARAKALSKKAM